MTRRLLASGVLPAAAGLAVLLAASGAFATPPENDTCETAIEMQSGGGCSFFYDGTTSGARDDYDPYDPVSGESCTGFAEPGPDVAFYADMYEGGLLQVIVNAAAWTPSLYVITDCGDPVSTCLAGDRDTGGGAFVLLLDLPAGRYYAIVDSGGGSGPYSLDAVVGSFATAADAATWTSVKSLFR